MGFYLFIYFQNHVYFDLVPNQKSTVFLIFVGLQITFFK